MITVPSSKRSSGDRLARFVAGDQIVRPESSAIRRFITWARPAAGSGKLMTWASVGAMSRMDFSRPVPSAPWRLLSDPNVVYVGMGEHAVRGVMTSPGDGVYKSTDAAKTWKKIGLELTQHISRVVIDPKNPNIVLVAAQGALYAPSPQRGIFKSIDG